jgi:hypothetical protein
MSINRGPFAIDFVLPIFDSIPRRARNSANAGSSVSPSTTRARQRFDCRIQISFGRADVRAQREIEDLKTHRSPGKHHLSPTLPIKRCGKNTGIRVWASTGRSDIVRAHGPQSDRNGRLVDAFEQEYSR